MRSAALALALVLLQGSAEAQTTSSGSTSSSTQVTVVETPGAYATNLTVDDIGLTAATVAWDVVHGCGDATTWRVDYWADYDDAPVQSVATAGDGHLTVRLEGLEAESGYTVTVLLTYSCGFGGGPSPPEATFRTQPGEVISDPGFAAWAGLAAIAVALVVALRRRL